MPKTQYFTATSIDGFIADGDNSLEWLFNVPSDKPRPDHFDVFFAGVGAMAMGSTTYEWVLAHDQLLDNPSKWHDYYGNTPAWVFTHRELPAIPGVDLTFVRDDVVPVHEQMTRAAGGKNLWVVGGGDLVGQFADAGLLDEILLTVAPVTLGSGAPLLPRRLVGHDLALTEVKDDAPFVFLRYAVSR
jgi:dihydrofolate reductase